MVPTGPPASHLIQLAPYPDTILDWVLAGAEGGNIFFPKPKKAADLGFALQKTFGNESMCAHA